MCGIFLGDVATVIGHIVVDESTTVAHFCQHLTVKQNAQTPQRLMMQTTPQYSYFKKEEMQDQGNNCPFRTFVSGHKEQAKQWFQRKNIRKTKEHSRTVFSVTLLRNKERIMLSLKLQAKAPHMH